jgi:UDP-N-acetylglucosamine 2-epimerase (non-hydrolysing)
MKQTKSKILIVYGTRPEAIKLAPLIVALKKNPKFVIKVVCTGQHFELLTGILSIWGISPDISFERDHMQNNEAFASIMMDNLRKAYIEFSPELVIVQGDTTSALVGTLQAYSMKIPVAHLEAGLRSGEILNPWPEEGYRRCIDTMSKIHFAPTKLAVENLMKEGMALSTILTGNTIVDSLEYVEKYLDGNLEVKQMLQSRLTFDITKPFIVFTQHRRESFGFGQRQVFEAIAKIAQRGVDVVFPVHPNPNVEIIAKNFFNQYKKVHLIPPLNYLEFIELLRNCSLIISDSGGLQEEAPSLNKSIIVTRTTTERPETIESGFGHLAGFDTSEIVQLAMLYLDPTNQPIRSANPFGDGHASEKIVQFLEETLWRT